jgi:CBS domain containing-hemolysin-like protein
MQLSHMPVRRVMVPRIEMVRFDLDDPPGRLGELFAGEKLAQIPVYKTRSENMLGVIHVEDFVLEGQNAPLRDLIRPVPFVPETVTVEDVLRRFRQEHVKMGFVVDEYGSVVGLVTMEDIIEEIVGEISDEYDEEPVPAVERIDEGRLRVRGDLSVRKWHEMFEMDMPELSVETIGGLVMTLLDRVPRPGDTVRYGNLELTVEKMRGPRVVSVVLRLVEGEQAQTPGRRAEGA